MAMYWLDHVNIRTSRLDEMSAFYEDVLGLKRGRRPAFQFGGAWHYCGTQAIVHLVESAKSIKTGEAQVEHFALRAGGSMRSFQRKLREHDAPYEVIDLLDINMRQVNVFDPDGNKIEVQFAASDNDDREPFPGKSAGAKRRFRKGADLNTTPPMTLKNSKAKVSKTNRKLGTPKPITAPKRRARNA
ncbi:MAG: glyoxalase [Alphaproteobacteria bacterium]|jgi:catechol 2,3-dioxygenase-like lactoylglutathione lyase family enzyme|nr:glyoxalase [Alphaproteobacteria bacterium]